MIKGYETAKRKLARIPKIATDELLKVIHRNSILLATHLKDDVLTGGITPSKLAVRSGKLRNSVRALKPRMTATKINGGIVFGTNYASTHVGKKGSKTTITAKDGYLTIPLDAMKTRAGASRGSAHGAWVKGHYQDTFVKNSKAGNLILFGKNDKKITPLFVLKKQVKIPARIHPSELINWVESRIITDARAINVNTN